MYQRKDIVKVEKIFNEDFESIYDWFVENKLTIHFGDMVKLNQFFSQVSEGLKIFVN